MAWAVSLGTQSEMLHGRSRPMSQIAIFHTLELAAATEVWLGDNSFFLNSVKTQSPSELNVSGLVFLFAGVGAYGFSVLCIHSSLK